MRIDPTLIGTVQDVSGPTISVVLSKETTSGISFVSGECYRVGQVGSFVRIPIGFVNLYGLVSQVGAGAAPQNENENEKNFGHRWIKVQLVGEGKRMGSFQRGISQYPTIDDKVYIVTEADLKSIYGPGDAASYVSIGHLASAESISSYIEINKLVTRHSAIVGTTGCGKSTTVAGLLNTLSNTERFPSARIIVFDIHGEYQKALQDKSVVFKIGADFSKGERELQIPFWALNFQEFSSFAFNTLDEKKFAIVSEYLIKLKKESLSSQPRAGVDPITLTVDTPTPFSLHKLWYDLYSKDFMTTVPRPGTSSDEVDPAYAIGDDGVSMIGDAMSVIPPVFRTIKTTGPAHERVKWGDSIGMRQQLETLGSKLRDPRYNFICNPGEWKPDVNGKIEKDLDILLEGWIGNAKPVTIMDFSGIPITILNDIIGAFLRILYDAVFWGRNLPEGARERPLLFVLEEAHSYLNKENLGTAATAVRRIAKEGRKYGVGLMVVSQRPSEIDTTILSQCGTIIAMRLTNSADRGHVSGAASDNLNALFDILPILRTGEAIIVGEAVSLPMRTLITPPPIDQRPDSTDPKVISTDNTEEGFNSPGGWNQSYPSNRYDIMVAQWRKQQAKYMHTDYFSKEQKGDEND